MATDREMLLSVDKDLSDIRGRIAAHLQTTPVEPKPLPGEPTPVPPNPGNIPIRTDFPTPGSSPPFTSQLGVVNCWKAPPSAMLQINNEYQGTPQELKTEVCISPTPGDFLWYLSPAGAVKKMQRGQEVTTYPYGAIGPTPGITWNLPGPMYVNMRYVSGGQPNTDYTVSFGRSL